jgi:hypothetical protein
MSPERYLGILREFDGILSYAKEVSSKLTGRTVVEEWEAYADAIYTKLVCHAISLRVLSPSLSPPGETQLWDVASCSAIARSLIEAYDALAYVAFHQVSPSERRFRVCLWELHDQQRRLRMLERIRSTKPEVEAIRSRAQQLAADLAAYPEYATASRELHSKVVRGEAPPVHFSQRDANAASNVNHDYYTAATMHLSQFVHTLPMSVHQLMHFRAGEPDALHACAMPIQYSMAFLAKAVAGMTAAFPEGAVPAKPETRNAIELWLGLVEKGVGGAG